MQLHYRAPSHLHRCTMYTHTVHLLHNSYFDVFSISHIYTIYTLFTADYVNIMESLFFNGSATFDRRCVNITILDDDVRELLSAIAPRPEQFWVLLRMSEPNDEVQLGVQTAIVSIQDDDCKLNVCKTIFESGQHRSN